MEQALLTGLGLAAPAGLNAYIPLLILALADRLSERIALAAPYDAISSTPGLLVLLVLLTIEIAVDKIPGLDHANDLVQTAIRPAAGAVLVLATAGGVALDPWLAGLLGVAVAGLVHAAKTAVRPVSTLGTGGLFNPLISLGEDMVAVLASVSAVFLPILTVGFLALFAVFAVAAIRRAHRSPATPNPASTNLRR